MCAGWAVVVGWKEKGRGEREARRAGPVTAEAEGGKRGRGWPQAGAGLGPFGRGGVHKISFIFFISQKSKEYYYTCMHDVLYTF